METNKGKDLVAYFSPGGSTRHVAYKITEILTGLGRRAETLDLGSGNHRMKLNTPDHDLCGGCLWIGSPTYALHAVPPVSNFISELPKKDGYYAVPFITYGGVTSGIALYEMGKQLSEKGFTILGAAKVLAVHSLMWLCKNPLGEGHPNDEDDDMVRDLVTAVHEKIMNPRNMTSLLPEKLNYQPMKVQERARKRTVEVAKKSRPPIVVNKEACTQCGECEEICPTQNISLDPHPYFGDKCVACLNCVRYCEPQALTNELLKVIDTEIRKRALEYAEPGGSEIFV